MKILEKKGEALFHEASVLAEMARELTEDWRPHRSQNILGKAEWEYESRSWYRNVLPLVGGTDGAALKQRLSRFVVETRAFLKDMQALKEAPMHCQVPENRALLYEGEKMFNAWEISWQIFLVQYEAIRQAFDRTDLECEDEFCGKPDEIAMPVIPALYPWPGPICPPRTASIFD